MTTKIEEKYINKVIPEMKKKFGYKSVMAVPKIEKVVVNTSYGRKISEKTKDDQKKTINSILEDLSVICGQAAVKTLARKAISSFKIRKGMPIGAKVTLRRGKMKDFLERLINTVLPRTRDFKGISTDFFDQQGNLTFSLKEHIAFPEVSLEKVRNIFGLEITVVTTAKNKEEAVEMFKLLGFPIKK
jgi:large subunit ribosomal protein L5